jgi:hypothetical protein
VKMVRPYLSYVLAMLVCCSGCAFFQKYPPDPITQNFKSNCIDALTPPSTCQFDLDDNESGSTATSIPNALKCTRATRENYGDFLECREEKQLLIGGSVVSLAAAAATVATAGISNTAAVALGGSGAGLLGFDIASYNKPKTKAYADGLVQLQCVIGESEPVENLSSQLDKLDVKYDDTCFQSLITKVIAPNPDNNLKAAEYKLAKRREALVRQRLASLGQDINLTTQNIAARAFAAAQSGVPAPNQIEAGAEKAAVSLGTTKPTGTGKAPSAAEAALVCDTSMLTLATDEIVLTLNSATLPQRHFPECLSLKAFSDSSTAGTEGASPSNGVSKIPSGSATGASKTNSSTTSGSASLSQAQDKTSSDTSDSTPKEIPTKVAFQVLPSDVVYLKKSGSTVIKLMGGTPSYFAADVDGDLSILDTTQTDLFVSYTVTWSIDSGDHRLLVGDQAGAREVVYFRLAPAPAPAPAGGKPAAPVAPSN